MATLGSISLQFLGLGLPFVSIVFSPEGVFLSKDWFKTSNPEEGKNGEYQFGKVLEMESNPDCTQCTCP